MKWSLIFHQALHFAVSTDSQGKPEFQCEETCSFDHFVLHYVTNSPLQINAFFLNITINISTLFMLNTILLLVEFYRTFLLFSVEPTTQGAIHQKENSCPSDVYLKLEFTTFLCNIKISISKTSLQLVEVLWISLIEKNYNNESPL